MRSRLHNLEENERKQYLKKKRNQHQKRISQLQQDFTFSRQKAGNPRYGGVITNAALMSMTSSPERTLPIARGAWIIEVILNDAPPPPPNDVPPLDESSDAHLTIREKFAKHRAHPDCAGCHARIDPLGFALENFNHVGQWREKYENKREVDATGTLLNKYEFNNVVDFKRSLVQEKERFAKAFTTHLLRFALARRLQPSDTLIAENIVNKTKSHQFPLRSIIKEVALTEVFRR